MYTDRNTLEEYAYTGCFYKDESNPPKDGNLLDDSTDYKDIILNTKCDIQKTDNLFTSGVITMGYTIYFPMPVNDNEEEYIPKDLKPGVRFKGEMYGMSVDGMVIGVYPTEMHGCVAYIKGSDI